MKIELQILSQSSDVVAELQVDASLLRGSAILFVAGKYYVFSRMERMGYITFVEAPAPLDLSLVVHESKAFTAVPA